MICAIQFGESSIPVGHQYSPFSSILCIITHFHSCVYLLILGSVSSLLVFLGDRLQYGSPYAIKPLSVLSLMSVCLSVCLSCLSCPVCVSVKLAYYGQTVGWIKMKLGIQEGLGPRHVVLNGDSAPLPPKSGHSPQFSGPCLFCSNS